jgi:asparagine synthase (glutamine-hydrolysing)
MWGLVIFDSHDRRVVLSRDRLGIKPLYLFRKPGLIAVASEIKQFLQVPGFPKAMNPETCGLYLLTGYEEPLGSLFCGVQQVPAGCWQSIDHDSLRIGGAQPYWHPELVQPEIDSPKEAGRFFAEKLTESVRLHLRSDVPVGCALSGGLDSTAIAVLIDRGNRTARGNLKTFSAVFPAYSKDERVFIDAVLREVVAEPFFVTPSPQLFMEDLNRFIWVHDEPPGTLSQYAAYCIGRLTREMKVPVALNGQGGDEILGGYWQLYFAYLIRLLREGRLLSLAGDLIGSCWPGGNPALAAQIPAMWKRIRTRRRLAVPLELREVDTETVLRSSKLTRYLLLDERAQRVSQIRDMFLPQLLKWDDRNFMAFSVEGRYPFLDHELIELCLRFQPRLLYSRGWTKPPLRNGLKEILPGAILKRRSKWGFETPQDDWLCGPLRPAIEIWLMADRPIWSWVEREGGKRLAERVWASRGRTTELGQMLFRLFVLDRWQEQFGVKSN